MNIRESSPIKKLIGLKKGYISATIGDVSQFTLFL